MAAATSICYFSLSSAAYSAVVARIDGNASADAGAGLLRLKSCCCDRTMLQAAATRGQTFNARTESTTLAPRASFQSNNSHCALMLLNSTQLGRTAPSGYKLLPKSPKRKFADRKLLPRLISNSSSTSRNSSNFQWEEEPYGDVMLTSSSRYKPGEECELLPPPHRSQADQFEKKPKFWIIRATTPSEGYAAAMLRAQCFYSYPAFTPTTRGNEGLDFVRARFRHDLHVQNLVDSRTKSEFERDAKMESANMNVRCLLAVCEASTHEELYRSLQKKRTSSPSMAPPALNSPAFTSKRLVALGTLDIQDGTGTTATVDVNTVTFQLYNLANTSKKKRGVSRGKMSEPGRGRSLLALSSGQSQAKHGYIFNLSVTENARRCGVATALMREAEQVSKEMQLGSIYVHVDEDNDLALALYQKLGYVITEVEDFDLVARFQRPRRILLSYSFQ